MKHYLLTWYGMTDLRAALGIEESAGPVLSALRSGDYSDVVLLAYTNPSKDQHGFSGSVRDEWEEWVTSPAGDRRSLSRDQAERIIDVLANTSEGHELVTAWLCSSLASAGVVVEVHVVERVLEHLNDAKGIHAAATAAAKFALSDPECGAVTTYVSPGTPIMAYTWALIARSNPQLDLAVISSSDPRRPPEVVELPRVLLDSSLEAPSGSAPEARRYDLVIHLLGEQTMPVLFGQRQFGASEHRILTSSHYEGEARRVGRRAGFVPGPIVIADPFRPADTRKAIVKQVERLPSTARVAVNLTGGTKLMFAGALAACWELGLDPFYFEVKHHNVIFLRDGAQVPFVGVATVDDLLEAGGVHSIESGRWPDSPDAIGNRRKPTTVELWKRRQALRELYRDPAFRNETDRRTRHHQHEQGDYRPFSFRWSGGEATLTDSTATLVLRGESLDVPREDFFTYLAGGWLEEYVHSLLRPLEDLGEIRDLRIGLEVGFDAGSGSAMESSAQEFDCAFTDGKRLWIVECKAGPVRQDAIQKLENNLRRYGGISARGILVSARPLSRSTSLRIENVPTITFVQPDELSTETLSRIIRKG